MDGSINVGDVIVCRVNGTSDLYVVGTVDAGNLGELTLSAVTTMVGLARAIAEGYRDSTPRERVWLFDGAASGYVKTTAPRSLLYSEFGKPRGSLTLNDRSRDIGPP